MGQTVKQLVQQGAKLFCGDVPNNSHINPVQRHGVTIRVHDVITGQRGNAIDRAAVIAAIGMVTVGDVIKRISCKRAWLGRTRRQMRQHLSPHAFKRCFVKCRRSQGFVQQGHRLITVFRQELC